MLKLRILSSMVLVPLIVWVVISWPLYGMAIFLGVFTLLAGWEWTRLAGFQTQFGRLVYVALLGLAGAMLWSDPVWVRPLLALAVSFWVWALIELISYQDARSGFLASMPGKWIGGFLVLLPAWVVPLTLRGLPHGEWLVLYLMFLVWGADTGAYFAGHRFGRHKLAPTISPGKTWEGVAGGLVVVLILAVLTGYFGWQFRTDDMAIWILLSLVTGFISVLGDLFESRIKRAAGVKDSGVLIPGHGGVLDRIDAFTAAAPVFALVWLIWQVTGKIA
jgi:phosphatidate cytidylyltransferase